MTQALRGAFLPAYVLAALVLGGSAQAVWGNLALQLGGFGLLGWAAWTFRAARPEARTLHLLMLLTVLLIALQLIPLPPQLWTLLRGREDVVRGFGLLGQPLPWLPISLDPYATLAFALALVPPIAMVVVMTRAEVVRSDLLGAALVGAALTSVLLGLLQVTGGGGGWYPYQTTNAGAATGLFANANHLAALLVGAIPFVAAAPAQRLSASSRDVPKARSHAELALAGGAGLILLVGVALTGSTAGLLLAAAAVAASLFLLPLRPARRNLILAGLLLAAMLVGSIQSTASNDHAGLSSRRAIWSRTLDLAGTYAPTGSGLGTFEQVYRAAEDPRLVDRVYVNRAHNDYLQLALETGFPGLLLLAALFLWWVRRTIRLWRSNADVHARAATIAAAVLLAHSAVDYPLRTAAVSVAFAMCLALMAGAQPAADARPRPRHVVVR